MASQGSLPGDVISIGGSSDDEPSFSRKRPADDSQDGQVTIGKAASRSSKRARHSQASSISMDLTGSEEGEVAEDGTDMSGKKGTKAPNTESGAYLQDNAPVYNKGELSLKLPVISQKPEWSWIVRFEDWVRVFYASNENQANSLDIPTVTDAFLHYVEKESKLKAPKKKTARQTAEKMRKSGDTGSIIAGLGTSSAATEKAVASDAERPADTDGEKIHDADNDNVTSTAAVETDAQQSNVQQAEVQPDVEPSEEQRRYFPSASKPGRMCLACGGEGHIAANCTKGQCKFCGECGHWDYTCATMPERCGKCHQIGHQTSKCVEKLALTMDEGLACTYCGGADHLEDDCTETWRSFHPDGESVKSVVFIAASCANCGSRNHFASDCSQRGKKKVNPTWTLRNRNLYLNPDSSGIAIEEMEGVSARPNARRGDLQIRGRATRTTHVHYSESDDSDGDLIGQKVVRPPAPVVGQIRIASNIQLPSKPTFNPPLPPGPPPPGPPPPVDRYVPPPPPPPPGMTRYNTYQPLAEGPASLPARPPPSKDYRNVPPPTAPRAIETRGHSGRSRRGPSPPPPAHRGKRGGGGGGGGSRSRGRGRGRGRGR